MATWATARNVPLRALAMHFALGHADVASCPVGCRTAEEVDEIVDAVTHQVPEEVLRDFGRAFDARVAALPVDAHWYYKKSMKI